MSEHMDRRIAASDDLDVRAERSLVEDDSACLEELRLNDWCGLPRTHPIHDELDGYDEDRWGDNHPFDGYEATEEQPLGESGGS